MHKEATSSSRSSSGPETVRRRAMTGGFFAFLLLMMAMSPTGTATVEHARKTRRDAQDAVSVGSRGPWVVRLDASYGHAEVEQHIRRVATEQVPYARSGVLPFVSRRYSLVHGLAVEGITHAELLRVPGVVRVVPDGKRRVLLAPETPRRRTSLAVTSAATVPWGLDRINQPSLPLDGVYTHAYDGSGVDVYIVDTGLDTRHVEFQPTAAAAGATTPSREVKNIYDAYGATQAAMLNPGADSDVQGHGTHVAGTVGGVNVGVAPGANLYGVKVLDNDGAGDVSAILDALDFIATRVASTGRRSVVSMSLGGQCETANCAEDSLVVAVEALVKTHHVVVSVAAGNEGCNACQGSPNSASTAISVGATDMQDNVAYFSDFGKCIDVFAPGYQIASACAAVMCGGDSSYCALSGTSMACPHASGVAAQLLQKYPEATPAEVAAAMSCDAAREQLRVDPKDTLSRNLLLQVPAQAAAARGHPSLCDLGAGCAGDCSGAGVCLPWRRADADAVGSNSGCHCDAFAYGADCSATADPACAAADHATLELELFDAYGDGWTFASYAITDAATGLVADGALDSLCAGHSGSRTYCALPGRCYRLDVSRGYFPSEIGWALCGASGGAPYSGLFCVDSTTGACAPTCAAGTSEVLLALHDAYGDGWKGGYYNVYGPDATQLYGGTLLDGTSAENLLCLPQGVCSVVMMEYVGENPSEVSYSLCGATFHVRDVVSVCVPAAGTGAGTCTASPVPYATAGCAHSPVPMYMFDRGNDGWGGAVYTVTDPNPPSSAVVATGTLRTGFLGVDPLCLADGCHALTVTANASASRAATAEPFWSLCGHRGTVPYAGQVCVDNAYQLCYGLSGCPPLVSHAYHSDLQSVFVSHVDPLYDIEVVDVFDPLHGALELCALTDGCYHVAVGAGRDDSRGTYRLCGEEHRAPSYGTMCVSRNGTACALHGMANATCTSPAAQPLLMAKLDAGADGWGRNVKYSIRVWGESAVVLQGTLASGFYEMDSVCLKAGVCYSMNVGDSYYADEVVWILCGYIGGAPAKNLKFCVTRTGCAFEDVDSVPYNKEVDDDFPLAIAHARTPAPTAAPTEASAAGSAPPSQAPAPASLRPTTALPPSATPTAQPTGSAAAGAGGAAAGLAHVVFTSFNVTVKMTVQPAPARVAGGPPPSTAAASVAVTAADVAFIGLAVRRALAVAGDIDVWSVAVPTVVAARPPALSSTATTAFKADAAHEAVYNLLASLPLPPTPTSSAEVATHVVPAGPHGGGGAAWDATMDRLQTHKRNGRKRDRRQLAGGASSPSSASTVTVTCVVEAGAVAPPGQTDLFFKEAMDIAVAVSEGTGALQAYIDTALFVTKASGYAPSASSSSSSSSSPASSSSSSSSSGVVIQLVSLTDVSVSPDAWVVAANVTTRPVDVLYNLVWPPGHADTGALDKIASAAKFFAYLASEPAVAAALAVGLLLLCCGGLCCCYCLLTRKAFLPYNPLDGSTSPVLDNSRRGLADASTHSTASAASAAAAPRRGQRARRASSGDADDDADGGLDGLEDGDGIELATLRRAARAADGGAGVPVGKQRRRWALPFGGSNGGGNGNGGRKGRSGAGRARGAPAAGEEEEDAAAEDGTVTVDFNPLRPPGHAARTGSSTGSGTGGSARVTARGARGSAATGATWWVRGNKGRDAGDFAFDEKETQL